MPYGAKVLYNSVDISDKVRSFSIRKSMDQYCFELDIEIADPEFYDNLDFSQLPSTPPLQILTRTGTEWVSQGYFYIERPSVNTDLMSVTGTFWGRSTTARLGAPFSPKITKVWDVSTTFFAICEEMCEACGLTWDDSYSEIDDFYVFGYAYEVEQADPIEVISELLEIAYGSSAFVTTDSAGNVCIKLRQLIPTGSVQTITDPVSVAISEEPEWPVFGNRVKITASGSTSGYSIDLKIPQQCMDVESGTVKAYARVTDQDGNAVANVPVNWSAEHAYVTFSANTTNTGSIIIYDELVKAKSFYEIDLLFPPSAIRGIYAFSDFAKTTPLGGTFTLDGTSVTTYTAFQYCDQYLRVDYEVAGVAVNYIIPSAQRGTDHVTAQLGTDGDKAVEDVYIDNPCQCPPTISISANPASIDVGESSRLLIYVENGGSPETRPLNVYLSVETNPAHGGLDWTQEQLTRVIVTNEEAEVQNNIANISQCETNMYIYSVQGVYTYTKDEDSGEITHTSGNLYSSFVGKTITLNAALSSETEIVIDYTCSGAVVCYYDGLVPGTDRVRTWIKSVREQAIDASCTITVSALDEDPTDPPEDCCDGGLCDADGEDCPSGGVFGQHWSSLQEGCWDPAFLKPCVDGITGVTTAKVMCYKEGKLGCYLLAECDTNKKLPGVECSPDTECCEHKLTGKRGCWPTEECATDVTPPSDPKHRDKNKHDNKEGADCKTASGMVKCPKDQSCCEKNGVKGCYAAADCNKKDGEPNDQCYTADCVSKAMDDTCLGGRFTKALSEQAVLGCSCTELCDKEFDKYGTTQSYMKTDPRAIGDVVTQDYGYATGSEEFWEKYEEVKASILEDCRKQCGDCASTEAMVVTGSDTTTKPGAVAYVVSGGLGPYTWTVSGTGATVSQSGLVTLTDAACGSYTVTVTDVCGNTGTKTTRVTNQGRWVYREDLYVLCGCGQYFRTINAVCNQYWASIGIDGSKPQVLTYAGSLLTYTNPCISYMSYYSCVTGYHCIPGDDWGPCAEVPRELVMTRPDGYSCGTLSAELVTDYGVHARTWKLTGGECQKMVYEWRC